MIAISASRLWVRNISRSRAPRSVPSFDLEDREIDRDAALLQALVKVRYVAGGDVSTLDLAARVVAFLLVEEDVLQLDDLALHPGDLGAMRHLAAAGAEPSLLDGDGC